MVQPYFYLTNIIQKYKILHNRELIIEGRPSYVRPLVNLYDTLQRLTRQ